MLNITNCNKKDTYKLLVFGSHCDDIEIGCGGTIINLLESIKNIEIYWVVMSSDKIRKPESLACAKSFLKNIDRKKIVIKNFRNGYFPFIGSKIKDYFEELKEDILPDIIFTHYRYDLHQDHRIISDLTWHTFRNNLILEYEIPKYDGDLSSPNFYVPLDAPSCKKKINNIMKYYKSQRYRRWFREDLFYSLLRIRGMECNSPSSYAEAFYCRKIVLKHNITL